MCNIGGHRLADPDAARLRDSLHHGGEAEHPVHDIGEVEVDDASPDPDIGDPDAMENWRINGIDKIDAFNYLDLSANWTFTKGIQWSVGINNITDERAL